MDSPLNRQEEKSASPSGQRFGLPQDEWRREQEVGEGQASHVARSLIEKRLSAAVPRYASVKTVEYYIQ